LKHTTALRQLINADALLPLAGVYDALSARLAERAGLAAVYVSGYCVSASLLGRPDVGYLTMQEQVAVARTIAERVDLPVIADGDDGYGNHLNVGRLVRDLERAGVAGLQIEDQVSPKRCGHMTGKRVVPLADMVAKVKAALDSRTDPDFIVIARTDAVAVNGFDDALERAVAFQDAGADVVFVEAPETPQQVARVPQVLRAPTVFNWAFGGRSPTPDTAEIAALGYRIMLLPDVVFAVSRALGELYATVKRDGTYAACADRMVDFNEFNAIVGLDAVAALDRKYGS
jgi:2-methylisocitrate lyase-like PEP mutase family enzyme